jgi:protein-disulfide isomerase
MMRLVRSAAALAGPFLLFACTIAAQDWKTAGALPNVDFSGLSSAQRTFVLKVVRETDCTCQCGMKVAECRVKDPSCSYSTGFAKELVDALRSGKSEPDALELAKASRWGHATPPRLLEDPVKIPISGSPSTGPQDAKITVVEFSDFQCPYCAQAIPQIKAVLHAYPKQVRLIFKQFPLEIHSQAELAAEAALAAQKQGKFWEMHDSMFANRTQLSRENILSFAKGAGLDMNRFTADMDSTAVREAIVRDVQDGEQAGVQGTPTLFINGQRYNGPIDLDSLKPVLEAQLNPKATQTASARN